MHLHNMFHIYKFSSKAIRDAVESTTAALFIRVGIKPFNKFAEKESECAHVKKKMEKVREKKEKEKEGVKRPLTHRDLKTSTVTTKSLLSYKTRPEAGSLTFPPVLIAPRQCHCYSSDAYIYRYTYTNIESSK